MGDVLLSGEDGCEVTLRATSSGNAEIGLHHGERSMLAELDTADELVILAWLKSRHPF